MAQIGPLDAAGQDVSLRQHWQYAYIHRPSAGEALDPEAIWQSKNLTEADPSAWMHLGPERSYVARFRLSKARSDYGAFVVVPSPQLDQVEFWWRASDGGTGWQYAQAGDMVLQADKAMRTPYPTFIVPGALEEADVVMAFHNQEALFMQAYAQHNHHYQQQRSLYGNGTGASLGLLGAVTLVCLLTLWVGRPEFYWLSLMSLASFFLYFVRTGVGLIGIWTDHLAFNNSALVFFGSLTGSSLVMVVSYLIASFRGIRLARFVYRIVAALGLLLALLSLTVLSYPVANALFRIQMGVVMLLCLVVPAILAFAKGDRVASWVSMAIMAIVVSTGAQTYSYYLVEPSDIWGVVSAVSWVVAILGLFAAAYGKFQYGFTALGDRLHVNAQLDQLTGLQNSKGFEQSLSLAVLAAGQRRDLAPVFTVLMCRLPVIEHQESEEYGQTISNSVEVRLAASIKQTLPETSSIARVQRGCFTALVTERVNAKFMENAATKIVSDVLNADDLPNFVSELGLQVIISQVPSYRINPAVFQALHSFGEAQEESKKTIHWVDLMVSSKPQHTR